MSENSRCSNVKPRVATGAKWIGLDADLGSLALPAGALVFLPVAYVAGRVAEGA